MALRKYSDQDICENSAKVFSLAELLRSLGLKEAGGNYANMKRNLQRLEVDTSHWTKLGWNKNQRLKDWSDYTVVHSLKKHLIQLRGNICENCKLSIWMKVPIPLEVHHIDADRTNNSLENLQLLCPNCHAMTNSWRGRRNGIVLQLV